MSSNGCLLRKPSRKILNLALVTELRKTWMWSTPYSLDTAATIALTSFFTWRASTWMFVFFLLHACVSIVLRVTMHSSNYTILNFLSRASLTALARSTASTTLYSMSSGFDCFSNVMHFFFILIYLKNFLILYNVTFVFGNRRLNRATLSSNDLAAHLSKLCLLLRKSFSWSVKCSFCLALY